MGHPIGRVSAVNFKPSDHRGCTKSDVLLAAMAGFFISLAPPNGERKSCCALPTGSARSFYYGTKIVYIDIA